MVMERKALEKILTRFQAHARGHLLRRQVRRARVDFEDIVREIEGNVDHLQWRDAIVSIPHFTDTDGPFPQHTLSNSTPTPERHCPETQPPERLLEKTEEQQQHQQLFPEKIEAERDGLHFQKQHPLPGVCSPGIPAGGRDEERQPDSSRSQRDSRGSVGGSTTTTTTTTVWSSLEPDTGLAPSHRGPQQRRLALDVPRTPEALRLHRNALSMELLWLQQAITSRKKYLSLKQRLSAS